MSAKKQTTFDGVSLATAKRIVDYEFGEALIKIEPNPKTQTYEVHITDIVEKKKVEEFKSYPSWQKNFIIKVYAFKYEM